MRLPTNRLRVMSFLQILSVKNDDTTEQPPHLTCQFDMAFPFGDIDARTLYESLRGAQL